MFAKTLGPAHPTTAIVTSNLASVMLKQDETIEAEALLRGTLATLEERLGPDHPDVALPMGLLAQSLVGREQYREALPLLERVLVLRQPGRAPPEEIAATHYALGDTLWLSGEDEERAIELVTRAYEEYAAIGEGRAEERERAKAWLVERGALPADGEVRDRG